MPATARKRDNSPRKPEGKRGTTVRIPQVLSDQARKFLVIARASSINELVVDSLEERLKQLRRQEIDKQFEAMATDEKYQAETRKISQEFEASDWHALRQTEGK